MTIGVSKSKGIIPTIGWNGGGQERFFAGGYRTNNAPAAAVGQAKAHLAGGGAASTFHIARAMTINRYSIVGGRDRLVPFCGRGC